MTKQLPSELEGAVEKCFETWDLAVDGEITAEKEGNGYEASVPFSGELLVEEALRDGHRDLLYNKEAEILFKGVRDGKLLLTIKEN
ncbi:hypothetical protein [Haloterrigena salifodinae]|uniref:hypothetical protein n=1 Tax=Haloterrigena salifodinae TaxID=2675099 RepID=UPI000F86FCD5|nr:hypothetical protein [Haloterrigena salifodinae]